MAKHTVAPGIRRANMPRRQGLSRWNAALRALRKAGKTGSPNMDGAAAAVDIYAQFCTMMLVPAPDFQALLTKIEYAHEMVFRHEQELGVLFGALVADARRLMV